MTKFARLAAYTAAISAGVILASGAHAQTYNESRTATFTVNLVIEADCTIAADPLDFGTTGVLDSNLDAQSDLTVRCTNTTPYTIGLDAGDVANSTVADRLLQGTATASTVAYQLYQDASRTTVWGNTPDTDTVGGVGTGSDQTVTVYGRVPTQDSPEPDTYAATVTATVFF